MTQEELIRSVRTLQRFGAAQREWDREERLTPLQRRRAFDQLYNHAESLGMTPLVDDPEEQASEQRVAQIVGRFRPDGATGDGS
jgi:hypothetical protein